jgi:hypothetical protein
VPARPRARVAGELDEVEMVVDRNRAREVGDEDEAGLQRRDEQGLAAAVIGRELGPELGDASPDLTRAEVDVSDALVRAQEANSRRYRWASRSTSRL